MYLAVPFLRYKSDDLTLKFNLIGAGLHHGHDVVASCERAEGHRGHSIYVGPDAIYRPVFNVLLLSSRQKPHPISKK